MKERILEELSEGTAMEKREYSFEILSSMLVHGAKPRSEAELRINTIKGILRYWWRVIQLDNLTAKELFRKEREQFGGIAGNEQTRSPIRLYLDEVLTSQKTVTLFPHRQGRKGRSPYIEGGKNFTLFVNTFKGNDFDLKRFDQFIHFFSHVASFGLRRRRGFGSVHNKDLNWKSKKDFLDSFTKSLAILNPEIEVERNIANRVKERKTSFPIIRGVYLGAEMENAQEALVHINKASSRVKKLCKNKNVLGSFRGRISSPLIATIRKINHKYVPVILDVRMETADSIRDFYEAREIFYKVVNKL